MTDIKISGMVPNEGASLLKQTGSTESSAVFDQLMQEALGKLNQVQTDADKAVKELASGGDVMQAIVTMEKADMNFQLMVEVRNKLLTAYEEILRMQV